MLTISQVARLLGVERETMGGWIDRYRDHLSADAKPKSGETRRFSTEDVRVLAFVAHRVEGGANEEEIDDTLQSGGDIPEWCGRWACENSPLFRDPPDGLDEDSYGSTFGGMASRRRVDVARSYWAAAEELLAKCRHDSHELDFPTLFLIRHSTELYLKALLQDPPEHHILEELIMLVEKQYGARLAPWIGARLRDFHRLDLHSDYFRYGNERANGEYLVDFHHLWITTEGMIRAFERVLRGESKIRSIARLSPTASTA